VTFLTNVLAKPKQTRQWQWQVLITREHSSWDASRIPTCNPMCSDVMQLNILHNKKNYSSKEPTHLAADRHEQTPWTCGCFYCSVCLEDHVQYMLCASASFFCTCALWIKSVNRSMRLLGTWLFTEGLTVCIQTPQDSQVITPLLLKLCCVLSAQTAVLLYISYSVRTAARVKFTTCDWMG